VWAGPLTLNWDKNRATGRRCGKKKRAHLTEDINYMAGHGIAVEERPGPHQRWRGRGW
jgi:hypothetical protein